MIKDRNIDPAAGIQLSKIMGGGWGAPAAKTFYAIASGTNYAAWASSNISGNLQGNVIQDIIDDLCVDGQPDHILVGPRKWQENILIMDRPNITLTAMVEGWATQMRPSDGSTKYTFTPVGGSAQPGVGIAICSKAVTVQGFLFDGGGGYTGIYVGDGYVISTDYNENTASARIRNNVFRGGGEGTYGVVMDGCSDDVIVEGNIFRRNELAGIYITPGGARTVQRPVIRNNEFIGQEVYGIDMYSSATTQGVLVKRNTFMDSIQAMTYGVRFQGAGKHALVGNWFACANKWSASSTDFISGNYGGNGADGAEVVSEA